MAIFLLQFGSELPEDINLAGQINGSELPEDTAHGTSSKTMQSQEHTPNVITYNPAHYNLRDDAQSRSWRPM